MVALRAMKYVSSDALNVHVLLTALPLIASHCIAGHVHCHAFCTREAVTKVSALIGSVNHSRATTLQ